MATKYDEEAARGGKVRTETAPMREKTVSGINNREAVMGRKMGGGPTDISHSISGGKVKKV